MNILKIPAMLFFTLFAFQQTMAQPINDGGSGTRKAHDVATEAAHRGVASPINDGGTGQRAKPDMEPAAASAVIVSKKKKPLRTPSPK